MKSLTRILLFIFLSATPALSADGMLTVRSHHGVKETADSLETILKEKRMNVFDRISHSDNATKAGLKLRPTELLIFGNPKIGTLLMQCNQSIAIDLPLKALIWEDEDGQVWLSYNDMEYLKQRHEIKGCDETIAKIADVLTGIARQATQR